MPEDFIKDLLGKLCEASLVADVYKCSWDRKTRTLTTKEEEEKDEETKAFESAPWFRDEFGFLGKKDQGKKHINPKALFNLDGNKSYKTIHDCHEAPKDQVGTPAQSNKTSKKKVVIDVGDSDEDTSEDDNESEASEDADSNEEEEEDNNRDSKSHTSNNSGKSNGSSNKGLHSKGSEGAIITRSNKDATGMAGSR
jgi:hypothetical protein